MKKRTSKRKSKKGVSHIETIISFSLFLLLLLFLFSYLNPVKKPDISGVLLDILEKGIRNNTITLLEIPVSLPEEPSGCFSIECPFDLSYVPAGENKREYLFVKDDNGNDLAFGLTANEKNITIAKSDTFLYYLYFSDEPFAPPSSPTNCAPPASGYNFSVPRLKQLYSYSYLNNLKDSYYNRYAGLKRQFNFPESVDFTILIKDTTTMEIYFNMSQIKPAKGAVKAREIPIELLKQESSKKIILKAVLNIQAW